MCTLNTVYVTYNYTAVVACPFKWVKRSTARDITNYKLLHEVLYYYSKDCLQPSYFRLLLLLFKMYYNLVYCNKT